MADILRDIGELRGAGMLVVLTPEGRVLAQAGATELRGLDLSTTKVVKEAQGASGAVVGSWVIGNKIIDLSIVAIRFGTSVIAYLVVGQTIEQEVLRALAAATGVSAGIAIGAGWAVTSDDQLRAMAALAQRPPAADNLFEQAGARYVASIVELEQMGTARPHLVLVQALAQASAAFSIFKWLLWLSPALVLIGMVLALSRSNYRAP